MSPRAANDPDQIRERAYQLWQADGCPEGLALDYWLRAEADLAGEADAGDPAIAGDDKPPAPMDEPVMPRQAGAPRGSRKSRENPGVSGSGGPVAAEDGGESSVA
jgi:hypothetical protein